MQRSLIALPVLFAAAATLGACSDRASPLEPVAPSATARSSIDEPIAGREASAWTTIDVPAATFQGPLAINDRGVMVGRYQSFCDRRTRGYRRSETGEFTTIEYRGAVFTVAAGINNRGDIVGHYSLPEDVRPNQQVVRHGYLIADKS